MEISRWELSNMRERLSATPEAITVEARQSAQDQPLAHVAQTGIPMATRFGAIARGNVAGSSSW
jgi:hypothetical protein